jgi:hypothetical protein
VATEFDACLRCGHRREQHDVVPSAGCDGGGGHCDCAKFVEPTPPRCDFSNCTRQATRSTASWARCDLHAPDARKHDHPAHYGGADNPYEVIKVLAAWFDTSVLPGVVYFTLCNTIKYLARAGKKPGEALLDDLRKARWYLDWAITWLEKEKS